MVNTRLQNTCGMVSALILVMLVSGCDQTETRAIQPTTEYSTIEWTELIPKSDLEALLNPPEFLNAIVDGSSEDQIDSQIQTTLEKSPETAYERALISSNVVNAFNSKNIRLPGFIVPLEFDENLVLTEFFLVPYFGACLHMPPPPPNQIIFVKHSEGFKLESIEQPYWVTGLLTTDSEVNDMAHAAYSLVAKSISPYEELY